MGGENGYVRGRSKAETYQKYAALVEGFGDTFQTHLPDPARKKHCKKLMVQDPETGEWVLHYHLHT
jgi:hypothetical protein